MKKNKFKNKLPVLFKKRNFFKIKNFFKIEYNKSIILFSKPFRLEIKKFVFLKKKFKKIFKKSKYSIYRKILVFLNKNYSFSKKSKNSRMGKGKGKFKKWILKFEKNHILFYITGFRFEKIFFFLKFLKKYGLFLILKSNLKHKINFFFLKNFFNFFKNN